MYVSKHEICLPITRYIYLFPKYPNTRFKSLSNNLSFTIIYHATKTDNNFSHCFKKKTAQLIQ